MMLDIQTLISNLKRPRLLVRAARFGLDEYRRDRALERLLKCENAPRSGDAIMQLIDIEADLNEQRIAKSATYAIAHHIEALTAIMGEAQILQATTRPSRTSSHRPRPSRTSSHRLFRRHVPSTGAATGMPRRVTEHLCGVLGRSTRSGRET